MGTYQVAWKNGALDQYIGWIIDSNGNYLSQVPSWREPRGTLESFETTLHQDLNGDATTGPTTAAIEAFGATSLTKVADSYFFNYASSGPQLKLNGVYVAAGQFGAWTPIGAEQAAEAAIRSPGRTAPLDQYIVWDDRRQRQLPAQHDQRRVGSHLALQSFESAFHQDLNGDGAIPIEAFGATKLVKSGTTIVLDPMASLGGPLLKYTVRTSPRVNSVRGRRSPPSRRRAAMRSPGRTAAPISTSCGTPTAAAITSRRPAVCLGIQRRAGIVRIQLPPRPQGRRRFDRCRL